MTASEVAAGPAGEVVTTARAWPLLLVASGAAYMAFLDTSIVNIAFPTLLRDFPGSPITTLSWVVDLYTICFAAALVPSGRLADRLGRRRLFLLGLVIFSSASLLCGCAVSAGMLIAARGVQACGAAMLIPSSMALVVAGFPVARRTTAIAFWGSAGAVAAATGPPLGGLIITTMGWRPIFFINLPIGVLFIAIGRKILTEHRDQGARMPDLAGAFFFAAAIAAIVVGITEMAHPRQNTQMIVAAVLVFGVAFPVFCWRSAHHATPVFEAAIFRIRSFVISCAAISVSSAGLFALLLGNILFLTTVWKFSSLQAGLAVCPGAIVAFVAAGAAGRLAERLGERFIAVVGGLIFACGACCYPVLLSVHPNYWRYLPATVTVGLGAGIISVGLNGAGVAEVGPGQAATCGAVIGCSQQVGASIGIAAMVAFIASAPASFERYRWIWFAVSGAGCLLAAIAALLSREAVR